MPSWLELTIYELSEISAGLGVEPQVCTGSVDDNGDGAEHAEEQRQLHDHQQPGEGHGEHGGEIAAPIEQQHGAGDRDHGGSLAVGDECESAHQLKRVNDDPERAPHVQPGAVLG